MKIKRAKTNCNSYERNNTNPLKPEGRQLFRDPRSEVEESDESLSRIWKQELPVLCIRSWPWLREKEYQGVLRVRHLLCGALRRAV